jgi:hypothetical protein
VFRPIYPGIARQNYSTPILQQKIIANFSEQVRKLVERTIGPGGHIDAAPSEIRVAPKHRGRRPRPKAPDCSVDEIGAVLRSIRSHT